MGTRKRRELGRPPFAKILLDLVVVDVESLSLCIVSILLPTSPYPSSAAGACSACSAGAASSAGASLLYPAAAGAGSWNILLNYEM